MSKRTYNIYFHLHTVSGITITVGLFIIFFAGAFTIFFKETEAWERSSAMHAAVPAASSNRTIDLDRMVQALRQKNYNLYQRNIYIDLLDQGARQSVYLSASEDSLATGADKTYKNLLLDRQTYAITEQSGKSSFTLAALLYDLHFFGQLGDPGYYLAGLISLFFLFAMVSGIIIHWKKIVSNFYVFRPYEKLKTAWTDAHTALGVIGIPFQFMYALTGAWFGLGILVATSGSLLYGGSQSKYYDEIYGHHEEQAGGKIDLSAYRLNTFIDSAASKWKGFNLTYISIHHAASDGMEVHIYGEVDTKAGFFNFGEIAFNVPSGTITHIEPPGSKSYGEIVSATIHRLHFGYFGLEGWKHTAVKALYFLLAVASCFVIITGVLIWLEARNRKNVPDKQRKYNERTGHIYLAICLSMLPVTALSFLVARLIPPSLSESREVIINATFFGSWLLAIVFFLWKRNNSYTNKTTLLITGILGLCIPLASGGLTGKWFWDIFGEYPHQLFMPDILWLSISAVCLLACYLINRHARKTS